MKDQLNILLLGSGGRERALAEVITRSPRCNALFCQEAFTDGVNKIDIVDDDFEQIADFCIKNNIDILLPGDEKTIVAGIRDHFDNLPSSKSPKVIAPLAATAALEGSKEFAKEFMMEAGIPTPRFMTVDNDTLEEGMSFLESLPGPYVLKADGPADGEGVVIVDDLYDAKDMLQEMIGGKFGKASEKVLVEEFVTGPECTVIIATDGEDYLMLPPARDYKRRYDGDKGPNTRGMGAYSPSELADETFLKKVEKRIIIPTLRALKERELPYQGFLYFGLMAIDGEPVVIEYNVRLGDPETQVILPRIKSDFVEILEGIANNTVGLKRIDVDNNASTGIVLYRDGKRDATVTACGESLQEATRLAYSEVKDYTSTLSDSTFDYRSDIGS